MDKTDANYRGLFSVIESGPDFEDGQIRDVYLKMMFAAKKTIDIVTPYLIIEPEIMAAIHVAVKSGVKIRLLVPGLSDYVMVGLATKSYYEQLLRTGVEIYEYKDHFVHSKILIVDDKIASVGSVNFDPRSFHLNFEVTAVFTDEAVGVLSESFREDLEKSNRITMEEWARRGAMKRFIQALLNLFSPIF
nr:phospholipase D-like domain-containing protein [Bacillota bacterium]